MRNSATFTCLWASFPAFTSELQKALSVPLLFLSSLVLFINTIPSLVQSSPLQLLCLKSVSIFKIIKKLCKWCCSSVWKQYGLKTQPQAAAKCKMKIREQKKNQKKTPNLNSTSYISMLIISLLANLTMQRPKSSHSGLQVRKSMKAKKACSASSWGEAKCLEAVLQMGHFPGPSCCPGLAASYPREQQDFL